MNRRLTPQQKKALSCQKDRRENYGQNDKASRRLVPLNKAIAQRRLRHKDRLALRDLDVVAETVPLARAKPDWRKEPGVTLGQNVRGKLRDRIALGMTAEDRTRAQAPDAAALTGHQGADQQGTDRCRSNE